MHRRESELALIPKRSPHTCPARLFAGALALAVALLSSGCGGDDPTAPPAGGGDTATLAVGPAGGTLTAAAGGFRLDVPAGALVDSLTLTVTRLTGGDVPAELAAFGATEAWDVEPHGVALQTPAVLTRSLPAAKDKQMELAAVITGTGEGAAFAATEFEVKEQGDGRVLVADIRTTGSYGMLTNLLAGGAVQHVPATVPCNSSFTATAAYELAENVSLEELRWQDYTNTIADNALVFDGTSGVITNGGPIGDYHGAAAGAGMLSGRMVFANLRHAGLTDSATFFLEFNLPTTCEECTNTGPFTGSLASLVTVPEAAVVIIRAWAAIPAVQDFLVAVAGANGWGVQNVIGGSAVLQEFVRANAPLFGLLVLAAAATSDKDSGYHEAVVEFGPYGAGITPYSAAEPAGWGWTQAFEMQRPVYDATNFTGPVGMAGGVYVASTYVGVLNWNESAQYFTGDPGLLLTYGDFAETFQTLVSAVSAGPQDPVLIVEDRGTDPGRIWLHARNGTPATNIGATGVSPRKVRTDGGIAAVSSFADDLLTIVRWDGGATANVAGTVAVGDGPVGIDVLDRGDGTVAIVSTGFNDDTYTLTVVDAADGSVVSNVTQPVPYGGQAPGHATWVRDGSRRIVITCNGSDQVLVLDSGM